MKRRQKNPTFFGFTSNNNGKSWLALTLQSSTEEGEICLDFEFSVSILKKKGITVVGKSFS